MKGGDAHEGNIVDIYIITNIAFVEGFPYRNLERQTQQR